MSRTPGNSVQKNLSFNQQVRELTGCPVAVEVEGLYSWEEMPSDRVKSYQFFVALSETLSLSTLCDLQLKNDQRSRLIPLITIQSAHESTHLTVLQPARTWLAQRQTDIYIHTQGSSVLWAKPDTENIRGLNLAAVMCTTVQVSELPW
jgi:hypothetical protein